MTLTAPAQKDAPRSVLLIHMPMADPILPNLGIELLAQRLRRDGIACDVFYGSLLLPPSVSPEMMHGLVGQGCFTPLYFDLNVDDFVAEVVDCVAEGRSTATRADCAEEIYSAITAAEICLERCLAAIPAGRYDVIGFSVIFDTQKVPSAALARRLKEREPALRILFGGTGCDGPMGPALMEHFSEIDAVALGDAEETITRTIQKLRGHTPAVDVANAIFRPVLPGTPPPRDGVVASIEDRPGPDYSSFIEQRAQSPYAARANLTLLFEASRGCWWGDKHHCRFCGIRTVREGYRERTAGRVLDEILALFERYHPDLIYATDAILSRGHMRDLLPEIARYRAKHGSGLKLFFEVKSNMNRREIALLAAAGVVAVQPGIESFSSHVLSRIAKGAKAIRQVEALKWLSAYRIDTIYGILVGTPGETAEDLRASIGLMNNLRHLQPPVGVNPLGLHRFSPYFADPSQYGIEDIRPFRMQELAFRGPKERLVRLCYELAYTSKESADPELGRLRDELRATVLEWRQSYREGEHLTLSGSEDAALVMRRTGTTLNPMVLSPPESRVCWAINSATSAARVAETTGLSPHRVDEVLADFLARGLAIHLDGAWLGLAVPAHVDAWRDAGLTEETYSPPVARAPDREVAFGQT